MTESNNEKDIIIVSHKVVSQPDDDLVLYLNNNKFANVLHITHSFANATDRKSKYIWYKKGILYRTEETWDVSKLPILFLYLKELFYTLYWVFRSRKKWDLYVGMDGLCVLFGNMLRFSQIVRQTIYWCIDFVPVDRFSNAWINSTYHWINNSSATSADEMWDLSPRMAKGRNDFFGIGKQDYKKYKLVQYGMWIDRIKTVSYENCNKHTLVFLGNLSEYQGLQIIIQALPDIKKKVPNIHLLIIGEGPYTSTVKELVNELHLTQTCTFLGRIKDNKKIEDIIASSALGVATYVRKMDYISRYADLGKIKTYLACGIPVIMTDVPWNASEIEKNKCGLITEEDPKSVTKAVLTLLRKDINIMYRKNARKYSKKFNYQTIFRKLFPYI